MQHKNGSLLDLQLTSFKQPGGSEDFIMTALADVTAQKQAEKALTKTRRGLEDKIEQQAIELSRSSKELEQFISIVSHDLKEPLYTISMYTSILTANTEQKLDPQAHEMAGMLAQMSQQAMQMIDGLQKFSRLKTRPLNPQSCDCAKIVESIAANYKDAAISASGLPAVTGDSGQLTLLFQSLIDNAVKFQKKEKPEVKITASLQQDKNEWLFSVSDNGIGMDKKYLEKIFQVFQRLHAKSEYPGTGIGLTLSRQIVENHGGKIWAESEPGKGTTFYFTLSQLLP